MFTVTDVTVIQGSVKMYHFNQAGKTQGNKQLTTGGFALMPKKMFHALRFTSPHTLIEVHFDGH